MLERLCFIHIPRTSGTSFMRDIYKLYSDEEYCKYRSMKEYVFSEELDTYKLFGGHTDYRITYILNNVKFTTFIAEPINRLISHYLHAKRNAAHPYKELLVNYTVDQAIDLPELKPELHNLQVMTLTKDLIHISDENRLAIAKSRLVDLWFFGIKEQYQQSLTLFQKKLEIKLDKVIDKSPKQHSLGLSEEVLSKLYKAVELDMELYTLGVKLFKERNG